MKKQFALLFLLLFTITAQADPGVGIVRDRQGNVFYTDLKQVWKITPEGKKSIAVPNVHTHELCLDGNDNLYGEHLWYEGSTDKWGHRVWSLKKDGRVVELIPAREGFQRDYSFIRDGAGSMYWAERGAISTIKMRMPDGSICDRAQGRFQGIGRMIAMPDGTLYLMDRADLVRIEKDGRIKTLATGLSERWPAPAVASTPHYNEGLWADGEGSVYVAIAGEKLVLKVARSGERTVVARSTGGWAPSGGLFDPNGNLWLLEFNAANEVRVRHIQRNGAERTF